MAQKTFKIGLSDTDKQNMAQDVYERLINMCFDTYNSANTYNEGDFVVYENPSDTFKLYKCLEDNVTGAWDSTKWQLATFQDLVDDIEGAVAFVNDKANIDGNYPTMTVGFADNLTPYDDESGDDQDEPFSFQATGTGNGSQADFATGSAALLKEKQGNTVVVNQMADKSQWQTGSAGDVSFTTSNGILIANGTANENVNAYNLLPYIHFIANHKYLIYQMYPSNLYTFGVRGYGIARTTTFIFNADQNWDNTIAIQFSNGTVFDNIKIDFNVIDLTQWFGSNDNIPQDLLDHPEHFFRYYQGSLAYNEGTLVNSNGRYIKCIGRQQWDEEWENGYYNDQTGEKVTNANYIKSKNLIKVIPNATYYLSYTTVGNSFDIYAFDKDKNFIGSVANDISHNTFNVPSNCCYIGFNSHASGLTTYNHDITISIYYEGESGYDQYYPYEVLSNIDTGTEILRSAGNAKDSKAPDNTITRRTGVVDLSTLSWTLYDSDGVWQSQELSSAKPVSADSDDANITCDKYTTASRTRVVNKDYINTVSISDNSKIYIYNGNSSAEPTGTLYYELAEPTTEQGTSFSSNLYIDDFGSMDFGGANGVPQGALIFYPVDYKAFIDTLYDYAEGTPSSLAKKTDLPTAPQTWAESLPGYDATKTQTLKNVQGTLTWVDDE